MTRNITRILGSLVVVLALGLVLGNSALAAGNSGPTPVTSAPQLPDRSDRSPHGVLVKTGTLACEILPSEVIMTGTVIEATGRIAKKDASDVSHYPRLVQSESSAQFWCIGISDQSGAFVVAADARQGVNSAFEDIILEGR
jgi:hypothetical protein